MSLPQTIRAKAINVSLLATHSLAANTANQFFGRIIATPACVHSLAARLLGLQRVNAVDANALFLLQV
jgi:hypothetical protein